MLHHCNLRMHIVHGCENGCEVENGRLMEVAVDGPNV